MVMPVTLMAIQILEFLTLSSTIEAEFVEVAWAAKVILIGMMMSMCIVLYLDEFKVLSNQV